MTYSRIQDRLEILEDSFEAEVITAELMAEVKRRTGRRPRYRDDAPDWALDLLKRKGYRI